MALNKSQIKALKIAAQHFEAGNEHAFQVQIMFLIRSAAKDSQVADIKSAAYDIQFNPFQQIGAVVDSMAGVGK